MRGSRVSSMGVKVYMIIKGSRKCMQEFVHESKVSCVEGES
jgi:hypothetical protein